MNEIPINNAGSDNFMRIDTFKNVNYIIAAISSVVFFIACCGIGYFGPQEVVLRRKQFLLNPENSTEVNYHVKNVSPKERYIFARVDFIKNSQKVEQYINYTFNSFITMELNGKIVKKLQFTTKNSVFFAENSIYSNNFNLFDDFFVTYDSININIEFPKTNEMQFAEVFIETHNPKIPNYQIYIRYSYIFTAIIVYYLYSLKCKTMKTNSLVQKMTKTLILVSIFGVDIFYVVFLLHPTCFLSILQITVYSFFMAFIKFYVLLILDNFRLRNANKGKHFMTMKVLYYILLVVIDILYHQVVVNHKIPEESKLNINIPKIISISKIGMELAFFVWFCLLLFYSFVTTQGPERKSIALIGFVLAFSLVFIAIEFLPLNFFYFNSLNFMMQVGAFSIIVFGMAYLTTPLENDDFLYYKDCDQDDDNQDDEMELFESSESEYSFSLKKEEEELNSKSEEEIIQES